MQVRDLEQQDRGRPRNGWIRAAQGMLRFANTAAWEEGGMSGEGAAASVRKGLLQGSDSSSNMMRSLPLVALSSRAATQQYGCPPRWERGVGDGWGRIASLREWINRRHHRSGLTM